MEVLDMSKGVRLKKTKLLKIAFVKLGIQSERFSNATKILKFDP